MAVETSSKDKDYTKKKKTGGMFYGAKRKLYYAKRILGTILSICAIAVIILCLFGYINQRQTGESIYDWTREITNSLGQTMVQVFTGDDNAPIKITDQGIYADGYEPNGSNDLLGEN
jgi:hypothetical protein